MHSEKGVIDCETNKIKNQKVNKKTITGIIISIFVIILFLIIWVSYSKNQLEYSTNLFYMDTYINVKLYTNDDKLATEALKGVENIYKRYHQLSDRYNEYDDLINIYYINNNDDKISNLIIENELCELLEYGIDWYNESNGLLNINIGSAVDVWKKYRDQQTGIPTQEELNTITDTDIKNVRFTSKCVLENNHPNIDLGALSKGYTTKMAGEYLKRIGVDKFVINAGGNALVGNHYNKDLYKIGIKDPTDTSNIFSIVKGENIAVVTSGGYERFYEYEGKLYHHILDSKTFMPVNYSKSVTVVSGDSALADALSTTLFLMTIEEGKEFIKNYDAQAIWYDNNNNIIKTEGFSKYE